MQQTHPSPWQNFAAADEQSSAVFATVYPAEMPDGRRLHLPLRDLGDFAVAGFIANQASFPVLDALVTWLSEVARPFAAEVVVGLPTLGHLFGAGVARALGHPNWVAPGTTRKLWYDEALSVPLSSVTSPVGGRRLWLDPRLLPRLRSRRVLLIDDVISTGTSISAALALLAHAGIEPVGVCAAMLQGERWQNVIPEHISVRGVFASPRFARAPGGWTPLPDSALRGHCPLLHAAAA